MSYIKYIKDKEVVKTRLRFCPVTSCTTIITNSLNNIRSLAGTVMRDRSLDEILQPELGRIKDRGFIIGDIGCIQ